MPFNEQNAQKYIQDNKAIFEQISAVQQARDKQLKELAERFDTFNTMAKALADQITAATDMGVATDAIEAMKKRYADLVAQQSTIADNIYGVMNPPEVEPMEGVMVPDANDPSGFSTVQFAPGEINEILRNPENLANTVKQLQASEDPADQMYLKAVQQLAGDQIIQQAMEGIAPEMTQVTGQDVMRFPARPSQTQLNEAVARHGAIEPTSRANAPQIRPAERIRANIEREIRKKAAQERENILGAGGWV